jgi:hypothetical protein
MLRVCSNPDCEKEWTERESLCPACGWVTVVKVVKVKKDKWTPASTSYPLAN